MRRTKGEVWILRNSCVHTLLIHLNWDLLRLYLDRLLTFFKFHGYAMPRYVKILRDCCVTIGKVNNTSVFGQSWPLSLIRNQTFRSWCCYECVRYSYWCFVNHLKILFFWKISATTILTVVVVENPSRTSIGPASIWGWGTKGTRTRKPGPKGPKNSNKMVANVPEAKKSKA
jgi:hypothetical protein